MRREYAISIAIEILGNGIGGSLQMIESINNGIAYMIMGISTVTGIGFLSYGIKKGHSEKETASSTVKAQAIHIHAKLIDLEKDLWIAGDKVAKGQSGLNDANVKKVYADIQVEMNNLATSINNSRFDRVQWAVISLYSRYLEHNINPYEKPFIDGLNMAHSAIRKYINKIKD